ncbi:hypothetical protein [Gordonia amicalis]|uniref:hypothetical protein n=1 Tax=Gordonia amicalis TaxID=89053 RepID=UPI0015F520EF|nr:hypothetical protein [Gordonia amicalis]MBA5846877.1 hypothetical protein [Gordonia amicalis]
MPTSTLAAPAASPNLLSTPSYPPATLVWTGADALEHQVAANSAVPHSALLDTIMRPVSGPNHVVSQDESTDGLLVALGGDQRLAEAVLLADRDPSVIDFVLRPAEIRWHSVPSAPTFVVPMLQKVRNRRYRVIDTMADRGMMVPMIQDVCREIGWEYTPFRPPSPAMMANLGDLACDRHWWVVDGWSETFDKMLTLCRRPRTIDALCRAVRPSDPDQARALVNFAIWHEFLIADLEVPITGNTEIISASAAR